jgi:excisionase family DNA binding protein
MNELTKVLNERLVNQFIQISADDLAALMEKIQQKNTPASIEPTPEQLYTRKETANRLRVSLPTLWKYDREGYIKSVRVGSRILYPESAIQNALKNRR